MKILITGGTGFIGKHLQKTLSNEGYDVLVLTRKESNHNAFHWNIETKALDANALHHTNAIVHLAGAGLTDKRWTKKRKKEILESRTKSAELLFEKLKTTTHHVSTFISASAVGIYGSRGEEWLHESSSHGKDFLSTTCEQWEAATKKIETLGIRVINFRFGIVLGRDGGALPVMAKPVRGFAGMPLGSGKQYLSWIHIDDLCRLIIYSLKKETMQGVYNAVASNPVSNKQFTESLGKVLQRPVWPFAVPEFMLKLFLGEMATTAIDGQRVSNEKVIKEGFRFKFSAIEQALKNIYAE